MKILASVCVGYVVLFLAWLGIGVLGMSWESFHTSYRPPRIALGVESGLSALALFALALGVALGRRWARWTSIVLATLILCLSVLLFWDGYLRVKPKYSGEEGSEVFMALIFFSASLCVLVAMFVPTAKRYFYRTRSEHRSNEDAPQLAKSHPTVP
jgi:hypothetical protein